VRQNVLSRWLRELAADAVNAFPGQGQMLAAAEQRARLTVMFSIICVSGVSVAYRYRFLCQGHRLRVITTLYCTPWLRTNRPGIVIARFLNGHFGFISIREKLKTVSLLLVKCSGAYRAFPRYGTAGALLCSGVRHVDRRWASCWTHAIGRRAEPVCPPKYAVLSGSDSSARCRPSCHVRGFQLLSGSIRLW
jgi:hypothetical protein